MWVWEIFYINSKNSKCHHNFQPLVVSCCISTDFASISKQINSSYCRRKWKKAGFNEKAKMQVIRLRRNHKLETTFRMGLIFFSNSQTKHFFTMMLNTVSQSQSCHPLFSAYPCVSVTSVSGSRLSTVDWEMCHLVRVTPLCSPAEDAQVHSYCSCVWGMKADFCLST